VVKLPAVLLIAYGLANAVLYSALLPLWEGFDEPFHFGYVQDVANGQGFRDPRTTFLSREAGFSLQTAPASRIVQMNLPEIRTTYSDYSSSPQAQRAAIRNQVRRIPPEWRWQASHFPNYETHHPPLAYLALALPERALASVPLPNRLLILRSAAALAGFLLLYLGAKRLFRELNLPDGYRSSALFCIFSCQMTWATIAHVANDWLAVPLAVWSLALMISYDRCPRFRTAAWVAGALALGLLTKAYFLALIPVSLVLCLRRKRWKDLGLILIVVLTAAGPWYARNILRYGTLTGMQESRAGIGLIEVVRTAPTLNWSRIIWKSIQASLWTGNNSFMTFSGTTLAVIAAFCVTSLLLWAISSHTRAEWVTILYCLFFVAALGYSTVVSFIYTHGIPMGPSPWYSQVLLAPMLGLAFLGCARSQRLGKLAATALVALFGYLLIATYVAKLIPLYGGFNGRTSLAGLIGLYSTRLAFLMDNLNLVSLAPAGLLLSLTVVVVTLAAIQMAVLARSID
jgi:hypothetical protein